MFIASFPAGPWQTNCYLLATEAGAECVVLDPGMDAVPGIEALVAEHRLKPVAVVLTHGHLDHMFSATPVCASHDAVCWVHPADRPLLTDPLAGMGPGTAALLEQYARGPVAFREPDEVRELTDGAQLAVAGLELTAVHAPGHTPGSVMFRCAYEGEGIDSLLFSGDVLFAGSIGRTDLPGGDHEVMQESLRRTVLPLPDAVAVLPGHGPQTTVGAERAANPYLRSLLAEVSA